MADHSQRFNPCDPCEGKLLRELFSLARERGCVEAWNRRAFSRFVEQARPSPSNASQVCPDLCEAVPVCVKPSLSASEINEVLAGADELEHRYGPQTLWCEGGFIRYGTAHCVLYLHHDGWLLHRLPTLCGRLVDEMRTQWEKWGLANSASLNVRCIELHKYSVGGCLCLPDHRDSGSSISMSVLLSSPSECHGGRFITWDQQRTPHEHLLQRGDAVLFHSERIHNVSPVLEGERSSLVIELWFGPTQTRRRGD